MEHTYHGKVTITNGFEPDGTVIEHCRITTLGGRAKLLVQASQFDANGKEIGGTKRWREMDTLSEATVKDAAKGSTEFTGNSARVAEALGDSWKADDIPTTWRLTA